MTIATLRESPFYKAGGNLSPDDQSYVYRPADTELFEAVRDGHYCYVLTSRQMGKSSLMHRTAVRLRADGVTPVLVDLTGIGTQVTPEQWYFGMLVEIARQLSLDAEMQRYWDDNAQHSPLYRFTHALADVVIARTETPLVLFIDEIDSVASIKKNFSTDEFFAAIRQCYNSRASSPEMARLTFCLLGVSTPADLIQDVSTTPFNIGRQIELTDFTETEAHTLIQRLDDDPGRARQKLKRIFHWTSGHPYLTQKLCLEVSRNSDCAVADVDRFCEQLFLANRVRTSEDNLIFVHNKLLRTKTETVDSVSTLLLYRSVLDRKRVLNNPADPVIAHLRLAGVVRAKDGRLIVRNRIYGRVFDKRWVNENLPDAEARRERAAYRLGVLRTVGVFAIVLGAILTALIISQRALRDSDYRRALGDMTQAQEAIQEPDLGRAEKLLKEAAKLGGPGMTDRFSWRYLWRASHQEERTMQCGGSVLSVAALPDGKTAAAIVDDGTFQLWDTSTGKLVRKTQLGAKPSRAAFSDDRAVVAVGFVDGAISAYNVSTGVKYASVPGHGTGGPNAMSIAGDHRTLAVTFPNDGVQVLDIQTGRTLDQIPNEVGNAAFGVAISNDAHNFAAGYFHGEIDHCVVGKWRKRLSLNQHFGVITLKYSSSGRLLAAGDFNGDIRLLESTTGAEVKKFHASRAAISDVCFLTNSNTLISGGFDAQVHTWDIATGLAIGALLGHHDSVLTLSGFADGLIVSGASDGTIKAWWDQIASADNQFGNGVEPDAPFNCMADCRVALLYASDNTAFLMDLGTVRPIWHLPGVGRFNACALSRSLKSIYIARKGRLEAWSVPDRRLERQFSEPNVKAMALAADATHLAIARADRSIDIFDVKDWTVQHLKTSIDGVVSLAFTSDETSLAIGGYSNIVEVWKVGVLAPPVRIPANLGTVDNVAFSPNNGILATNGCHNVTILWDTQTWNPLRKVDTPPDVAPGALLFSPDGSEMVTGDTNGGVKLWNVSTGDEIISLNNDPPCIDAMAFSRDGTSLAAIAGRKVLQWHAPRLSSTIIH